MTSDIEQAARALHAAGAGGFARAVAAAEAAAAQAVAARMHASVGTSLPRRGGLAAEAQAATSADVSSSSPTRDVVTSITLRSPYNLDRMNTSGSFSHPVFGDAPYVDQSAGVTQGFLDDTLHRSEPELLAAAEAAVTITARIIDRSV